MSPYRMRHFKAAPRSGCDLFGQALDAGTTLVSEPFA